jgi:hypothetical protein
MRVANEEWLKRLVNDQKIKFMDPNDICQKGTWVAMEAMVATVANGDCAI